MPSQRERCESVLRSVYDDDDFVFGTLAVLRIESNFEKMLAFVRHAEEVGDEVTHDDLVALSIVLRERSDGRG